MGHHGDVMVTAKPFFFFAGSAKPFVLEKELFYPHALTRV